MNQLMNKGIELTSLDIAEVTGKEHKNVLADIRKEIKDLGNEIGQLIFQPSSYINSQNKKQPCYTFGKEGAMQLALKYDATTRYKVIKRIEELESHPQQLPPLELALQAALEHEREIKTIKSDVQYLKGNMRIDSLQQQELQQSVKRVVVQALGGMESNAYEELSRKVFPAFWKEFKQHFKVPRYPDLPKMKFDEAMRFIELWRPNTSLQMSIDHCNSQMKLA